VKPICTSKKQYRQLLDAHVTELAVLQRMHYASDRYGLPMAYPEVSAKRRRELQAIRKQL
jgi:hypothetical protein